MTSARVKAKELHTSLCSSDELVSHGSQVPCCTCARGLDNNVKWMAEDGSQGSPCSVGGGGAETKTIHVGMTGVGGISKNSGLT